jgi:hypothetical protein
MKIKLRYTSLELKIVLLPKTPLKIVLHTTEINNEIYVLDKLILVILPAFLF